MKYPSINIPKETEHEGGKDKEEDQGERGGKREKERKKGEERRGEDGRGILDKEQKSPLIQCKPLREVNVAFYSTKKRE